MAQEETAGQRKPTPRNEPRDGYTGLGIVLRPHGLRGEVRVQAFNPEAPHMQQGARVWIQEIGWTVNRCRPDRGAWVLALEGITSRSQAEELRSELIEAPDEMIGRAEGEHFVHDLIGMEVVTDDGYVVGRVTDVLQPGANDVYVVDGERGEVLIPVIEEVVRSVDEGSRRIFITPLPGLLDDSGY